jgi:hypothetical protein
LAEAGGVSIRFPEVSVAELFGIEDGTFDADACALPVDDAVRAQANTTLHVPFQAKLEGNAARLGKFRQGD